MSHTPVLADVIAAAARASARVAGWPQWKRDAATSPRGVRMHTTKPGGVFVTSREEASAIAGEIVSPRILLRESLERNAAAVAAWPDWLRACIDTREIFNPGPPRAR